MKKNEIVRLLVEGGLIVFSVLFALFIDRLAEDYKTREQKKIALTRIHMELTDNQLLMQQMVKRHDLVIGNLGRAVHEVSDTLRRQMSRDGFVDYRLLANGQSLYPRVPGSTSWEAAKSTGIISEFDYRVVEACTKVYALQEIMINVTLRSITDDLIEVETVRIDNRLTRLRLEFEGLRDQEKSLVFLLDEAIKLVE